MKPNPPPSFAASQPGACIRAQDHTRAPAHPRPRTFAPTHAPPHTASRAAPAQRHVLRDTVAVPTNEVSNRCHPLDDIGRTLRRDGGGECHPMDDTLIGKGDGGMVGERGIFA